MKYTYRPLKKVIHTNKAVDILYKKMMFYDTSAMLMAKDICELLKDSAKARGDKLAEMFKHMMRFNDICIDCASKLAPYQSAKLESVEIKKKVEHSFVIRAPVAAPSSSKWLEQVQQTALPPPIFEKRESLGEILQDDVIEADYEIDNTLGVRNGL